MARSSCSIERATAPEVNDSRAWRMQRRPAPALRFDVSDLATPHPAQPRDAVGMAARFKLREPRQLIITHGDDQLPAALVGNGVSVAVFIHQPGTLDAQPGLERAWPVVNAAVNHARVVAGLVIPDSGMLVDDNQFRPGAARRMNSRATASPTIPAPTTARS